MGTSTPRDEEDEENESEAEVEAKDEEDQPEEKKEEELDDKKPEKKKEQVRRCSWPVLSGVPIIKVFPPIMWILSLFHTKGGQLKGIFSRKVWHFQVGFVFNDTLGRKAAGQFCQGSV